MGSNSLAILVPWVISNGYFLFFLAALLEGSLISTAAGVASALGYFNIFIILFLSLMGDVVADLFYYSLGIKSHGVLNSKFFKYIGVTEERVSKVKELLHTHVNKSLVLIKLSPFMGPPGLLIVGALKVPFKKFFKAVVVISVIKSVFFVMVGYFSGVAYLSLSKIMKNTTSIVITATFIFLIYFIYKTIANKKTDI